MARQSKPMPKSATTALRPMSITPSEPADATSTPTDAIKMLKADHRKVEGLFQKFEAASSHGEKEEITKQICQELVIHTILEEEIFYPACRHAGVQHRALDEAQIEHDSVKILIADIKSEDVEAETYDAKVKVLSEYVKHHVAEEEKPRSGIFAAAQKSSVDMNSLGSDLSTRKQELKAKADREDELSAPLRSLHLEAVKSTLESQEHDDMARNSNYRERDERGRFVDDDDDRRYGGRSGGRSQGSGYYGDSQGHSMAARGRSGSSRYEEDDDDDRRGGSRGHGGWFGDSEGHSQAARSRSSGGSSQRDDDDDYRRSRYEQDNDDDYRRSYARSRYDRDEDDRRHSGEGQGWHGDPRGHSEASRRGCEVRGSSRNRDDRDDDDDRRHSSGDGRGWYGDPEGHARASRRGWRNR